MNVRSIINKGKRNISLLGKIPVVIEVKEHNARRVPTPDLGIGTLESIYRADRGRISTLPLEMYELVLRLDGLVDVEDTFSELDGVPEMGFLKGNFDVPAVCHPRLVVARKDRDRSHRSDCL